MKKRERHRPWCKSCFVPALARLAVVLLLVLGMSFGVAPPQGVQAAPGTWSTTGSLNTARMYHTATLLSDGKVLVVGGVGS